MGSGFAGFAAGIEITPPARDGGTIQFGVMADTSANACEQIADSMAEEGWSIAIRVIVGHNIPWMIYATRGNGNYHVVHSDDIIAAFIELRRIADAETK